MYSPVVSSDLFWFGLGLLLGCIAALVAFCLLWRVLR